MRLLTRADFDGLACGTLLKELGIIDNWKLVHPKDVQDGLVEATNDDVLCNIPYVKGCKMWFDHHASEQERLATLGVDTANVEGDCRLAPSAARVVYDYYGGDEKLGRFKEMIAFVDKVDSAQLTREEILNPEGWVLLGFVMDPRSGLGRFRKFRISNYELMEVLIELCRSANIKKILDHPDVAERTEIYFKQSEFFKQMIRDRSTTDANIIITDLRGVQTIYAGNRFLVYSLFPDQNISIWITDGRAKINCAIAVGHSILNRTSKTNVGKLLLQYAGGGHEKVGTCQVPYEDADRVIAELIAQMKKDG